MNGKLCGVSHLRLPTLAKNGAVFFSFLFSVVVIQIPICWGKPYPARHRPGDFRHVYFHGGGRERRGGPERILGHKRRLLLRRRKENRITRNQKNELNKTKQNKTKKKPTSQEERGRRRKHKRRKILWPDTVCPLQPRRLSYSLWLGDDEEQHVVVCSVPFGLQAAQ